MAESPSTFPVLLTGMAQELNSDYDDTSGLVALIRRAQDSESDCHDTSDRVPLTGEAQDKGLSQGDREMNSPETCSASYDGQVSTNELSTVVQDVSCSDSNANTRTVPLDAIADLPEAITLEVCHLSTNLPTYLDTGEDSDDDSVVCKKAPRSACLDECNEIKDWNENSVANSDSIENEQFFDVVNGVEKGTCVTGDCEDDDDVDIDTESDLIMPDLTDRDARLVTLYLATDLHDGTDLDNVIDLDNVTDLDNVIDFNHVTDLDNVTDVNLVDHFDHVMDVDDVLVSKTKIDDENNVHVDDVVLKNQSAEISTTIEDAYQITSVIPDLCHVGPNNPVSNVTPNSPDVSRLVSNNHVISESVTPGESNCNTIPSIPVITDPLEITDIHLTGASGAAEADAGSINHLLQLVRALASNLPPTPPQGADMAGASHGRVNLGFEDNEVSGAIDTENNNRRDSDDSSNEDIDWSWLADEAQLCTSNNTTSPNPTSRPSSWLRASMRRVRRFALPHPRIVSTPTTSVHHSAPPLDPPRSHSFNQPPSSCIPDILNTSHSVPPSCIHRPIPPIIPPDPPRDQYLAVSGSPGTLVIPSAPPESPSVARNSDDFPRRYSLLGQLDQGRRPSTPPEQPSETTTEDGSSSECEENEDKEDRWPHALSSLLASLGCTLGLFNVSRFAILSVHFGANFVLQFLFLSLVIGWPLYVLHASLGQHLKAGVVDMWRISPLFQGIGIALLLSQAMLGLYSVVGVAWLFTYFRDSFINKYDAYRWAENGTKIEESVSDYLNVVVLQRQGSSSVGHLKFQVTFNLAVVWMIVFVCLSKGIKSYGKSVYLYGTLPILGLSMLAIKILTITDVWFSQTAWSEMFFNQNCWAAAAIECFTTWGLLGAATMQMRTHAGACRLSREVLVVGIVTVTTLISAALLANGFSQLLEANDLRYVPSSFERSAVFLSTVDAPRVSSTPVRWMNHGHFIVGLQVTVPGTHHDTVSGYQVAQFATELAPSVFAKLGAQNISPFWTVLFYFTLIMLGISQQLCIWHCIITGVMAINISRLRSWETTITFLSCACGFVLGLPMTTELGVTVVYFMDYCVGGAWWLILLQAAQIVAALMAQGGEQVAQSLLGSRRTWLQAIIVFTWNVVIPVSLTVASVAWFKTNNYRDLYTSRYHGYWPAWARRLGCLIQLVPLIIVPFVSAIQAWRYLTNGPSDLFDRLRLLCRPASANLSVGSGTAPTVSAPSQSLPELTPFDDPPPKYTPPPSYATATGARIAKLLRRSFRRLVGPSAPSPPDYSAVLVEMGNAQISGRTSTLSAMEVAHILRSSMRRTLRRDQTRSAPSTAQDSSKTAPVI